MFLDLGGLERYIITQHKGDSEYLAGVNELRDFIVMKTRAGRLPSGILLEDLEDFYHSLYNHSIKESTISRGGVIIGLSQKPNILLTSLERRVNRISSRGYLTNSLWGQETTPDYDRALNVHMRRLRVDFAKLGIAPIETRRGIGYSLVDAIR